MHHDSGGRALQHVGELSDAATENRERQKEARPEGTTRASRPQTRMRRTTMRLVDTLERRHRLALVLVERLADDVAVLDVDGRRLNVVLPREGVLHPVLIVTLQGKGVS